MTLAALPVKLTNRTSPSMCSAKCRSIVVLPQPANPNKRKICSDVCIQRSTAFSAASCSAVHITFSYSLWVKLRNVPAHPSNIFLITARRLRGSTSLYQLDASVLSMAISASSGFAVAR
jgi:hypothetical protein